VFILRTAGRCLPDASGPGALDEVLGVALLAEPVLGLAQWGAHVVYRPAKDPSVSWSWHTRYFTTPIEDEGWMFNPAYELARLGVELLG
jgi:hypothetical protein